PEQVAEAAQTAPSEAGFEQLARFSAAAPGIGLRPVDEGIWEGRDHYALIIPAHIVPNPVSTVGMGDTISSATFALEVEVGREVTTGPGR
ncbi:MAG TPA: ADP-dependent glucokinase/phosphofructokinase, partial [Limnochordia bacterium]